METDNRLIAEFMGYIKESNEVYPLIYLIHEDWFATDELKFHNDWDWLMEVVEKIRQIPSYDKGDRFPTVVSLTNSRTEIYSEKYGNVRRHDKTSFSQVFIGKGIETTFRACVEFINWYNEQKL